MSEAVPARHADLKTRVLSAIVMLALAAGAFWAGGWVLTAFIALIAAGMLFEWSRMVPLLATGILARVTIFLAGAAYIGVASWVLWVFSVDSADGLLERLSNIVPLVGAVIATDIGAYFAGRGIGGPKIAPSISPNKTWAGLGGGMLASAIWFATSIVWFTGYDHPGFVAIVAIAGALIAVIAQSGDFLESGLKRRAGIKDSSTLIPGHGGLLDRLDGLIAVLFAGSLLVVFG